MQHSLELYITTEVSIILNQLPVFKKSNSQNCRCDQTSSNHQLNKNYSTSLFVPELLKRNLCPGRRLIWGKDELRLFRQLFLVC